MGMSMMWWSFDGGYMGFSVDENDWFVTRKDSLYCRRVRPSKDGKQACKAAVMAWDAVWMLLAVILVEEIDLSPLTR